MLSRVRTQLEVATLYQQVGQSEERYALAFAASNDGLWDWDIETGDVFYSSRWRDMMGMDEDESMDSIEHWFDRVHPDDVESLRQAVYKHLIDQDATINHEYRALFADGQYRWMLCHARALFSRNGKAKRMTASQSDISATKVFDPITGLPNSVVFMDRLNRVCGHCERSDKINFALISMSLDNREKITSVIGSAGFDKLSTEITERLSALLSADEHLKQSERETMLSFSSDQRYMLLIEDVEDHTSNVLKLADRLQQMFVQPFMIFGETVHCTLSMGVCIPSEPGQSADELTSDCLTAERIARRDGSKISIYDSVTHGKAIDRLHLENELRTGISNNELRSFYQPIVSLADGGSRVGSESLVRWQHPERGLLSPYYFIEMAEEAGLIGDIDDWIFRETCRQHKLCANSEESVSAFVSVNVSVKHLDSAWVERIKTVIQEYAMPPESIHLEITESIFMGDIETTIRLLNELVDLGISFAIDDFGTGYSSFSYLSRLPASYLKIDKAFVDDLTTDLKAEHLVRNIIDMGHGLGMKIIAEGIELKEQAEALTAMGCDYGQGYYFGRPAPAP